MAWMPGGKIFISYRRRGDDPRRMGVDQQLAGRLRDRLERHFDAGQLLLDVDAIPLGSDFVERLDEMVASCEAFLAVVGPDWLETAELLGEPSDFVRIEIEAALRRPHIPIVPVFVEDARMPAPAAVPESLHPFLKRQGITLRYESFAATVDGRLASELRQALDAPPAAAGPAPETSDPAAAARPVPPSEEPPSPPASPAPRGSGGKGGRWWVLGAVVVALIGAGILLSDRDELWGWLRDARLPGAESLGVVTPGAAALPEMVAIPAGGFLMGSPEGEPGRDDDETPQHRVRIAAFELAKTEVTFDQWQACVDGGGCTGNPAPGDEGWGRGARPVINVSWHDAQEYIAWLNSKTEGRPWRLPSEAEWEYAARAGSETAFPWGGDWDPTRANGAQGGPGTSVEVASYPANAFGLHDMIGNAWEWVEDCWHESHEGAPGDGSARHAPGGGACASRTIRGGSRSDVPEDMRAAERGWVAAGSRNNDIGFRPARTPAAE